MSDSMVSPERVDESHEPAPGYYQAMVNTTHGPRLTGVIIHDDGTAIMDNPDPDFDPQTGVFNEGPQWVPYSDIDGRTLGQAIDAWRSMDTSRVPLPGMNGRNNGSSPR